MTFYFDPLVQLEISKALKLIRGGENIDDARQEAYTALADEGPLTIEDAIVCAKRAIERFRYHLRKESGMTIEYQDNSNYSNWHDAYDENDREFLEPSRIDRKLFLDTERFDIPHISSYSQAEINSERAQAKERGRIAKAKMGLK